MFWHQCDVRHVQHPPADVPFKKRPAHHHPYESTFKLYFETVEVIPAHGFAHIRNDGTPFNQLLLKAGEEVLYDLQALDQQTVNMARVRLSFARFRTVIDGVAFEDGNPRVVIAQNASGKQSRQTAPDDQGMIALLDGNSGHVQYLFCQRTPSAMSWLVEGVVIDLKLLLFKTLRSAYFVLRKSTSEYTVSNTQYEALFRGA